MILAYSQKISKQIPKALKNTLGLEVKSVKRLKGGEVNYSFKAETTSGSVIVRVFRYEEWPSETRVRFVEEKLRDLKIRHSKVIYWERPGDYFLNGFMVGEWIEGILGEEAINKKLVTIDKMFSEVAKILKKVHTIEFAKFGKPPFIKEEEGEKDFSSFVLSFKGKERLTNLIKDKLISRNLFKAVEKKLRNLLGKLDDLLVGRKSLATLFKRIWGSRGKRERKEIIGKNYSSEFSHRPSFLLCLPNSGPKKAEKRH